MNLSFFLSVIDGSEHIKITDCNSKKVVFDGEKFLCPCLNVDVIGVWANNGVICIEIAQ